MAADPARPRAQSQAARRGRPRRDETGPDLPSAAKASQIGAGHPGLAAQARRSRRTARRGADGSRWAAISSSSRIGAAPSRRCRTRSACASTRPISSAFCSPVEHTLAGISLGPCPTTRSERCGPSSVRPAARSRSRPARQRLQVVVLDVDRRARRQIASSSVPVERELGPGKRRCRPARCGAGRWRPAARRRLRRATAAIATPVSAMMRSKPVEARRLAHVVARAGGCAAAWRARTGRRGCGSRDRSTGSGGRGSGGARRPGR